jgi:acyl CoA:acetate/3-ketoacid CoA transferase alpha subunit
MVRFRKAVQNADIEWEDYTNYQMTLRFFAGSLGIPFMVTKTSLGSDIILKEGFSPETRKEDKVARKKLAVIDSPFSDRENKVVLVPAINADVALIHAQYVSEEGTLRIEGLKFTDVEIAKCADKLVVTCEEIVPESYLRKNPDINCLPFFLVDAIVPVPYGAHPKLSASMRRRKISKNFPKSMSKPFTCDIVFRMSSNCLSLISFLPFIYENVGNPSFLKKSLKIPSIQERWD